MDGSFCQRFFQRQRDLVRAGGVLAAAGKALEAPDGVLRPEPREQGADAFQVAVAAAHDCNGFDDAVVCERHFSGKRANAFVLARCLLYTSRSSDVKNTIFCKIDKIINKTTK